MYKDLQKIFDEAEKIDDKHRDVDTQHGHITNVGKENVVRIYTNRRSNQVSILYKNLDLDFKSGEISKIEATASCDIDLSDWVKEISEIFNAEFTKREMTVEQIEKQLGYKVKIVGEHE